MAFPYLGTAERTYVQYVNAESGTPLIAEPGQSYDMALVPGADEGLTVPPSDGLWGTRAAPASRPAAKAADKGSDDGKAA
jgi:hypothetical protein